MALRYPNVELSDAVLDIHQTNESLLWILGIIQLIHDLPNIDAKFSEYGNKEQSFENLRIGSLNADARIRHHFLWRLFNA